MDVKPCLEYRFAIKVSGPDHSATLELPTPLGPASPAEVLSSRYVPEAPSAGFAADAGAQLATLRWDPVDCAASYDVSVRAAGGGGGEEVFLQVAEGETEVRVGDLRPCTAYEVTVNAYLGDEVGEFLGTFATR